MSVEWTSEDAALEESERLAKGENYGRYESRAGNWRLERGSAEVAISFVGADDAAAAWLRDLSGATDGLARTKRDGDEVTVVIGESRTVRFLQRLLGHDITPTKVAWRAADLLPAQTEAIRQAVPDGTEFDVIDDAG